MVDAAEALKQVQDWGGAPANSKFVCSTCKSDAGVMAEFFAEVSSGQKGATAPLIFIAPNCRSATDTQVFCLHACSVCTPTPNCHSAMDVTAFYLSTRSTSESWGAPKPLNPDHHYISAHALPARLGFRV